MDQLPVEFQSLLGKVNYVVQISENEYHSSCPNCGGEVHQDGSYPDRFVMWRVSRRGTPFGMCVRQCGYKWTLNKEDAKWTPEERAEFTRKQAEMEVEWMRAENERILKLSERVWEQEVWKRCHNEQSEHSRLLWNRRGVRDDWQDYLYLGWYLNYPLQKEIYHSNALTIPLWNFDGGVENITLRMEKPQSSNDRYRRLYPSKAQHLYAPMREKKNKVVLMEGEIKAIIGCSRGFLPDEYCIYGAQSKSPERRILKQLEFAEVIYLAFDPDAYIPDPKTGRVAVIETAKTLGMERVRFVVPPKGYKFDDAILQGYKFRNAVNMAVKTIGV